MENRDPTTLDHDLHDHVPRGGRWARWIAISFALIVAVVLAPQSWKMPLGVLSIVALVIGVGILMIGERRKPNEPTV